MILGASSERKLPISDNCAKQKQTDAVGVNEESQTGLAYSIYMRLSVNKTNFPFFAAHLFWVHHMMRMGNRDERTRRAVNTLDPLFV